jgi:hypothetical protein
MHTVNGLWQPYKHTLKVRLNNDLTNSQAYNTHRGVLCLLRVYALYGRSPRILVLLILLGMGSFVTSIVGCFPLTFRLVYACSNIILSSAKVSLFLVDRKIGDETIPVISPFGGCAQYTPDIGYVANLVCDSPSSMIRLITLVTEVDVSHRVTITCLLKPQGASHCHCMGRRICR